MRFHKHMNYIESNTKQRKEQRHTKTVFLFTQMPRHSPIKSLEFLNISEL